LKLQDIYKIKYITLKKLNSEPRQWIEMHLQILENMIAREITKRVEKKTRRYKRVLNQLNVYSYTKYL